MKLWPAILVSGLGRTEGPASDADLLQAALVDHDVGAIDETADETWRVYFATFSARDRALTALRTAFPTLTFEPSDVPDEDWAARSQAAVRAIQVGRLIVAPPWDVPIPIVIQPSMGFGTGHHATTRLCLAALQRFSIAEKTVLDVGTGSAVLAIAAHRLGAASVTGIDDDPDAVQAAWDNLALNPGVEVSLVVGDLRTTELTPADVVLANLTGGLLIAAADSLRKLVAPGGRLIVSGFMTDEEADVLARFTAFSPDDRGEEDGWVGVTLADTPR